MNVEVDIILSDNEITDNGAGFKFSFGAKLGSFIFIVDHDITVSRTGLEYPILKVEAVVNETLSSRFVTNKLECYFTINSCY